jgi:CheY-like chemotaxis protein
MAMASIRVLLVEIGDDVAKRVETMLSGTDAGETCQVERVADFEEAWRLFLCQSEWDVILYELKEPVDSEVSRLCVTHEIVPAVPIVVLLANASQEPEGLAALAAGADDYLNLDTADPTALLRTIRKSLHRVRLRGPAPYAAEPGTASELDNLSGICGPAALTVSAKSLGSSSLGEREPEKYVTFVERYRGLLDRALNNRLFHNDDGLNEDVNRFADSLGSLNAGPRDVIDLHKEAISKQAGGQNGARARAYVDEGRLVMLQVMGHLASFYRSLSWGQTRRSFLPTPKKKASSNTKTDARRRRT